MRLPGLGLCGKPIPLPPMVAYLVPLRVPLKRSLGILQGYRVQGFTWRFMGSYKWVLSPLIWVISIVTLLITPLISTHEPPSMVLQGPQPYKAPCWKSVPKSHPYHWFTDLLQGLRALGFKGFRVFVMEACMEPLGNIRTLTGFPSVLLMKRVPFLLVSSVNFKREP